MLSRPDGIKIHTHQCWLSEIQSRAFRQRVVACYARRQDRDRGQGRISGQRCDAAIWPDSDTFLCAQALI